MHRPVLRAAIENPGANFIEMMVPSQDKIVPFVPSWVAGAKERGLTLVNNPALKALAEGEEFSEPEVESWLKERQEYYRGVRERVREQIPPSKHAEFDRTVEQDGLGFMNIELQGRPLGFSLGGKQPEKKDDDSAEDSAAE